MNELEQLIREAEMADKERKKKKELKELDQAFEDFTGKSCEIDDDGCLMCGS